MVVVIFKAHYAGRENGIRFWRTKVVKWTKCIVLVGALTLLSGFGLGDVMKGRSAIEKDVEAQTGMKPDVSVNTMSGTLTFVMVTFPRLDKKPAEELAGIVKASVAKQFSEPPKKLLIAFELNDG